MITQSLSAEYCCSEISSINALLHQHMKWTSGNNRDELINGGQSHFFFITVEYFIYLLLFDVTIIIALNIRAACV